MRLKEYLSPGGANVCSFAPRHPTNPPPEAMESLIVWYVLLAMVAGMIASLGARSWWTFFGISLLFTPAVGIVLALFAASPEPRAQPDIAEILAAREFRACPHCAERVRREASKCRFCGGLLDMPVVPRSAPALGVGKIAVQETAAAPQARPQSLRAVAKRAS